MKQYLNIVIWLLWSQRGQADALRRRKPSATAFMCHDYSELHLDHPERFHRSVQHQLNVCVTTDKPFLLLEIQELAILLGEDDEITRSQTASYLHDQNFFQISCTQWKCIIQIDLLSVTDSLDKITVIGIAMLDDGTASPFQVKVPVPVRTPLSHRTIYMAVGLVLSVMILSCCATVALHHRIRDKNLLQQQQQQQQALLVTHGDEE